VAVKACGESHSALYGTESFGDLSLYMALSHLTTESFGQSGHTSHWPHLGGEVGGGLVVHDDEGVRCLEAAESIPVSGVQATGGRVTHTAYTTEERVH
jgi:hypothetical protein